MRIFSEEILQKQQYNERKCQNLEAITKKTIPVIRTRQERREDENYYDKI